MNCWDVLEINPTTDKKVIKKAYSSKSKITHPEENAEGFRILHDAYKEALEYAEMFESNQQQPIYQHSETKRTFNTSVESSVVNNEQIRYDIPKEEDIDFDTELSKVIVKTKNVEEKPKGLEDELDINFDKAIEMSDERSIEVQKAYSYDIIIQIEDILMKPKLARRKDAWSIIIESKKFTYLLDSEIFVNKLTHLIRVHKNLPPSFYKAINRAFRIDDLKTRDEKGIYSDLVEIYIERNKMSPETKGLIYTIFGGPFILGIRSGLRAPRSSLTFKETLIVILIIYVLAVIIAVVVRAIKQSRMTYESSEPFYQPDIDQQPTTVYNFSESQFQKPVEPPVEVTNSMPRPEQITPQKIKRVKDPFNKVYYVIGAVYVVDFILMVAYVDNEAMFDNLFNVDLVATLALIASIIISFIRKIKRKAHK